MLQSVSRYLKTIWKYIIFIKNRKGIYWNLLRVIIKSEHIYLKYFYKLVK